MAGEKSNDSTVAAQPDISCLRPLRRGIGQVASTTPILPPLPAVTTLGTPLPVPQAAATNAANSAGNPCEADADRTIPTFLRLGSVCLIPVGFMDFTPFWRDKNAGSSMGSNFGGVPYNNSPPVTSRSSISATKLANRFPYRRRLEGHPLHRLQRVRLQRNQWIELAGCFQRRDCPAPSSVLGGCPQEQGGVPCRPELEHAHA